ncbi:alpha/beta hydrolase family protein [Nocardia nova SH22a]|uniref:Alpha/beta hydrolase family protein n=1 Tax=Nocardia nova SH22a TaxID=1415166 RepID=W5TD92_9NOCA|nr:alpha/beta hydrolase [Nocardia nova]AHH15211.1 alpha/beta hydrolase family protein [Nocardia nova SH22a]
MTTITGRTKVRFWSNGEECAAWHYPGKNGACIVMAGGLGVTKEPATDRFAPRFQEAGFSVLAFDFRYLGESGGKPRQFVSIDKQLADWRAAIDFASTLPEVDPAKTAIWGFSLSGGYVLRLSARDHRIAAAVAVAPLVDGPASGRIAMRRGDTNLSEIRGLTWRAFKDAGGALFGRDPQLVALNGEPGSASALTSPDARNGNAALNPDNRYPEWRQEVSARSALTTVLFRPASKVTGIRCPLLVVAFDDDGVAYAEPAVRAAHRAPRGELVRLPGGHYAAVLDQYEPAVEAQVKFLRQHLV